MATYKKRGYKQPKEKIENVAGNATNEIDGYVEGESATEELFDNLDESANKVEEWVADNQKMIFTVIGAVALVVLLYMAYTKFVQEPNEAEASNDAYVAQNYFFEGVSATGATQDSLFNLALNGGNGKQGLLSIADNYSGTKTGNLANYIAGMTYLNMNDYKNAVSYLDKYSNDDEMTAPSAKGAMGDAFVQLNQLEDALGEYEKALAITTNDYTTPKFLYKAAIVALELGQNDVAAKYLTQIKDDFSSSLEASKVDALLGKATAK